MDYIRFMSVEPPYVDRYFSVEYDPNSTGVDTPLIVDKGCDAPKDPSVKNVLRNMESLFIPMTL